MRTKERVLPRFPSRACKVAGNPSVGGVNSFGTLVNDGTGQMNWSRDRVFWNPAPEKWEGTISGKRIRNQGSVSSGLHAATKLSSRIGSAQILWRLNMKAELGPRYVESIANAKWEVREFGLLHNGYVDLLRGEFNHYEIQVAHEGICKDMQDILLDYGVEVVVETLMSLDLQVLTNGLHHFVSMIVKPKLQMVETFTKAYYLPNTEYVYWACTHTEYTKSQIVGVDKSCCLLERFEEKNQVERLLGSSLC